MGYNTDLIGHFTISPALNSTEREWLTAYGESRRWDRPEGPYVVPGNPLTESVPDDIDRYNRPATGAPGLWCHWTPCWDGDCLTYSGVEKFYEPTEWLEYLISQFLKPRAVASRSGDAAFEEFTFDHYVDGVVAARRQDTGRLWLIQASRNKVIEATLIQDREDPAMRELLPYEVADATRRARRRPRRRAG